ncbi:hypothetical protein [Burkholderia guangdongensis]|uniref:hypothetical protein n=1 Tax=Burkholderia guangdongensis TaxID=1792500 RepID=UPI0015CEB1A5|nr:hypothetical protein [Burkholderia guangdongensis]
MTSLAINDLHLQRDIDRNAMSFIRGAGAPWVFGWIQPYAPPAPAFGPVVNLYQTNNTFYANQVVNQFQTVDVANSAANSNLTVTVGEDGRNRLA